MARVVFEELRSAVVQPWLLDVVQSFPVNPFVHMHEHTPSVTTLVPPFAQTSWLWQSDNSGCAVVVASSVFRITKNSSGTMIAAAITNMRANIRSKKPHRGRPQHRRPVLLWREAGCCGGGVIFSGIRSVARGLAR